MPQDFARHVKAAKLFKPSRAPKICREFRNPQMLKSPQDSKHPAKSSRGWQLWHQPHSACHPVPSSSRRYVCAVLHLPAPMYCVLLTSFCPILKGYNDNKLVSHNALRNTASSGDMQWIVRQQKPWEWSQCCDHSGMAQVLQGQPGHWATLWSLPGLSFILIVGISLLGTAIAFTFSWCNLTSHLG